MKNSHKFKCLISVSTHTVQEDITNYYLIPDIHNPGTHIIQTHRIVPCGLGEKILKKRVFQVSSIESLKTFRSLVINDTNQKENSTVTSDTLTSIADSIDASNSQLTNGLLVIGGAICLAEPISGVEVIGSGFTPNIKTESVTHSVKPLVVVNKVLSELEKAANNSDYEPSINLDDPKKVAQQTFPLLRQLFSLSNTGVTPPKNIIKYLESLSLVMPEAQMHH